MTSGEAIGIILGFVGLVCAGLGTWISMVIKVAKLEEQVRIESDHYKERQTELKEELVKILEELTKLREEIHRSSGKEK